MFATRARACIDTLGMHAAHLTPPGDAEGGEPGASSAGDAAPAAGAGDPAQQGGTFGTPACAPDQDQCADGQDAIDSKCTDGSAPACVKGVAQGGGGGGGGGTPPGLATCVADQEPCDDGQAPTGTPPKCTSGAAPACTPGRLGGGPATDNGAKPQGLPVCIVDQAPCAGGKLRPGKPPACEDGSKPLCLPGHSGTGTGTGAGKPAPKGACAAGQTPCADGAGPVATGSPPAMLCADGAAPACTHNSQNVGGGHSGVDKVGGGGETTANAAVRTRRPTAAATTTAAATAAAAAKVPEGCVVLQKAGVGHHGPVVAKFSNANGATAITTPNECAQKCAQNSACTYWVVNKARSRGCVLKSNRRGSPARSRDIVGHGFCEHAMPSTCTQLGTGEGHSRYKSRSNTLGPTFKNIKNAAGCAAKCSATKGCTYWLVSPPALAVATARCPVSGHDLGLRVCAACMCLQGWCGHALDLILILLRAPVLAREAVRGCGLRTHPPWQLCWALHGARARWPWPWPTDPDTCCMHRGVRGRSTTALGACSTRLAKASSGRRRVSCTTARASDHVPRLVQKLF